jgi:predicted DNA-binding ribbon-helix-helix protein
MCHIFAAQSPKNYTSQTRSVRLGGHVTSIRLEMVFWDILEEISNAQDMPLGKFLTELHDEVMELSGTNGNFASLLRCACLTYVGEVKGDADIKDALHREAAMVGERLAVPAE